jgi:hypothetical protein
MNIELTSENVIEDVGKLFEFKYEQARKTFLLRLEELKQRVTRNRVNFSDAQLKAFITGHAIESAGGLSIDSVKDHKQKELITTLALGLVQDAETQALQKEIWEIIELDRKNLKKPWWRH